MIYLTNAVNIPIKYRKYYGLLASSIYEYRREYVDEDCQWLLDNDAFSGNFDTKKWLRYLIENDKYIPTCIGVSIPDVVGDALTTLRQFSRYWKVVKDLGYPVAFVSQDGITPEITPWDNFQVLFVGGTDDHKLNNEAGIMIAEAKARGKWVHIGRVNSESRIRQFYMADSVDGTHFRFVGEGVNGESRKVELEKEIANFADAIEFCRQKKFGKIKANGQTSLF